jgi:predicted glutamine amidotransferase
MCELFAISSRLPTTVSFSLQRFAQRGGLNGKTLDGWGLAYYEGRDLRLYREPEPARDSVWLPFIGARQAPSNMVVSHIRHATRGAISLANTQPFVREIGGRMHCFAHNGKLLGIDSVAEFGGGAYAPVGETDSELAACALFGRIAELRRDTDVSTPRVRLAAVERFAAEMRELGPANFLYADGELLFSHGHRRTQADGRISPPGLWMLQRNCDVDSGALAEAGVRVSAGAQQVIMFASVPLTDESWRALDEGEVVCVRGGEVLNLN